MQAVVLDDDELLVVEECTAQGGVRSSHERRRVYMLVYKDLLTKSVINFEILLGGTLA